MDSLGISDSTLWDALRHDASLLGGPPDKAEVVVSSLAGIQILEMSENSFTGGIVLVSYCVADETAVHCFFILTHADTSVAAVRMAFRAEDVLAYMDICGDFSSFAFCVDVGGCLRYIVIGPLPPTVLSCCLRVLPPTTTTTTKTKTADSPSHSPSSKQQRFSISLPPPRDLLGPHAHAEITPGALRQTLLRALPARHACLLSLPSFDALSRDLRRFLQWPGVLEALLPPSLGGAVRAIAGPCGLRAAAWSGAASAVEANMRPAEKGGLVAVLQEALVVLLVEEGDVEVHCCVVPWNEMRGFEEWNASECSRDLHLAVVEPTPLLSPCFASGSHVPLEPNYKWLSIKFPTDEERSALEAEMCRAYYASTKHKMFVFKAEDLSAVCLGVERPYCAMVAVEERQALMGLAEPRRKLHDPPKLWLSAPKGSMSTKTHTSLLPSADTEDIAVESFAKLLLFYTPIVFLLFECVICPFDTSVADLFISAFAELSSHQDNTMIDSPLVLSVLRAEGFLRRHLPTSRGPLRRAAHRASCTMASAACEEIVVRFLFQQVEASCDVSQVYATATGTHFEEHILPGLLTALRALPRILVVITFIYDALHSACRMDNDEKMHVVAELLFAALHRVARRTANYSPHSTDTTAATTRAASGIAQVHTFLRGFLGACSRGHFSAQSGGGGGGGGAAVWPALRRMAALWSAHAAESLSALCAMGPVHALCPEARAAESEALTVRSQHQRESMESRRYRDANAVFTNSMRVWKTRDQRDVSVQTVRTSMQEEEQLRNHLRLHTKLRFLEETIEQEREQRRMEEEQSKKKADENLMSAGVPFFYLQTYRAHLVRVEALEREVDELKQCCAAQGEEIRTLQSEKDALTIAASEAVAGPSLSRALEVFGVELRRFLMEQEAHGRDKIEFTEVKGRTSLLSAMLRFT